MSPAPKVLAGTLSLLLAAVLATATATAAPARPQTTPDHLTVATTDVSVPSSTKKPPPFCKKGQKSTKKKPCRKHIGRLVQSRTNPPIAGWKFGFSVTGNADGTWALNMAYRRTVGSATETHGYSFQLTGDAVSVALDLSTFTLNTGAQLGQFGTIAMSLSSPGGLTQGQAPAGCTTGTWQTRSGALTGPLTFVANGTYFKTLVEKSLPVTLSANTSGTPATCGSAPLTCVHGQVLFAGSGQGSGFAFGSVRDGALTLSEGTAETVGPAKIAHVLTMTNLPASDLTMAPDLSTATLSTNGASPWFSGSVSFKANGPATPFQNTACGSRASYAQGPVSGDLAGHFAAIASPAPPAGQGTLETF